MFYNWRNEYQGKLVAAAGAAKPVKPGIMASNVNPPDKHGWMTYGACGGMALHKAKEVPKSEIVTVQKGQPKIFGEFTTMHVREVDAVIETDVPIPNLPSALISIAHLFFGDELRESLTTEKKGDRSI